LSTETTEYAGVVCVVDRQKMIDDYRKQVQLIFQQWETDLEKTCENENKLQVINTGRM